MLDCLEQLTFPIYPQPIHHHSPLTQYLLHFPAHVGSIAILPRIRPQKFLDDSGNVQWFVTDVCIRDIYIYIYIYIHMYIYIYNYNVYIYIYVYVYVCVYI